MKTKMKGLTTVIALAVAMSTLVACSSSTPNSGKPQDTAKTDTGAVQANGKKVTITVWHGASGNSAKFLESLIQKYQSGQSNVEVKLVYVATDDMVQKLTSAAAGNALPDAGLLMWPQWVGPLKDVIRPVDDFAKADKRWNESDFLDTLLDGNVRFNGVTYGVPMETNNLGLFYNKKLFKEAGLEPPKTWDELISTAQKLTNPAKKQWGIVLPTTKGGKLDFYWGPFLWQAGGEYANKEGTDLLFNSDAGRKSVQLWVDLVNKYKVASLAPPQNGFTNGLIAMDINGPWQLPNYKAINNLDFGIAPLPAGPGGKATSIGGTNDVIFKTTPEKEKAAWDMMMWLASPEITAEFAAGYGSIPVRKSSSEQQVWKDFLQKNPDVQVFADSYKFGKIRPYNLLTYTQIANTVSSHIEAALQNKETVDEALQKAYDESKPLVKTWLTK